MASMKECPFDARATEENVRAYGSYLGVIAAPPVDPQYQQFVASVNEYLESPPFSYPNPLRVIGRNKHIQMPGTKGEWRTWDKLQGLETFYKEHIHEYDEIRYVQDGSGYFDIRDKNDQWIRVEVTKGDMLIEPAGLYHRFSMDSKDYIKAGRFFTGVPVWTPLYRPEAETHPTRVAYLKSQQKQA
ncbi:PREDICTED: 1,2-dihydroxy-3-keto-5-methylthiopentene dioxygenase-like [Priapulus caudatus]|uniref:acireductone dioxygenase (Fe(2+)-requiring) n=1 Tax=Priapulus caudatus TaxID=37621 RepID=A0ABM1F1K9_PRICU|nr:PREDICTED: 1,2-dihydroxy-3-keto-5-methylthiopentene dioxygenase-like [Priapulus caudatus]